MKSCFVGKFNIVIQFETPTSFLYCARYLKMNMIWGEYEIKLDECRLLLLPKADHSSDSLIKILNDLW